MIDRYGEGFLAEITARDGTPGVVDTAVLQVAVDDAVALVESYVAGLYNTANPPRALTVHAAAIAWYRLLGARAAAFDGAKDGHDAAGAFLRQVRKGEASLGDETPEDTGRGNPQLPQINAPLATFSRDSLKGF
jgi:phage gp36-like protein